MLHNFGQVSNSYDVAIQWRPCYTYRFFAHQCCVKIRPVLTSHLGFAGKNGFIWNSKLIRVCVRLIALKVLLEFSLLASRHCDFLSMLKLSAAHQVTSHRFSHTLWAQTKPKYRWKAYITGYKTAVKHFCLYERKQKIALLLIKLYISVQNFNSEQLFTIIVWKLKVW